MKCFVLMLLATFVIWYCKELIIKDTSVTFGQQLISTHTHKICTGNDGHEYYIERNSEGKVFLHLPDCKKCRVNDSLLLVNVLFKK